MNALRFDCRYRYASGFELAGQFEASPRVTALCGPSGAGKSTTLALIAGILRPLHGTIALGNRVLGDTGRGLFVPVEGRGIGCVFQDHRLFPHLSVADNLRYGLKRRPARTLDLARVVEILELGDLLDRYPRTLSGGEKQRVALGRALLRGPQLLLLDEPLTGLEPELKARIAESLQRILAEWQIPMLLVSHDPADVARLADRVVLVQRGQIRPTPAASAAGASNVDASHAANLTPSSRPHCD